MAVLQDDVIVVVDSPKISCGRSKARVDDVNAFLRCNVRAKPKATSIFWILSGNGTTLSNDEVIDDCWTVIRVRAHRLARPALGRGLGRCDATGIRLAFSDTLCSVVV